MTQEDFRPVNPGGSFALNEIKYQLSPIWISFDSKEECDARHGSLSPWWYGTPGIDNVQPKISSDGELQLTSQRFRDQSRNVDDCLEKLRGMLAEVAVAPKPRKKTNPSRASRERRLTEKRRQSARKQLRRRPPIDD